MGFKIKKVTLPSGKLVEVVSYESPMSELEKCPKGCARKLVYPLGWAEEGDDWRLRLRCPECWWETTAVYGHPEVERFDTVLNEGTDVLVDNLERLSRANFESYIERFIDALKHDNILAEDF